jgi:hypothetical protein
LIEFIIILREEVAVVSAIVKVVCRVKSYPDSPF